MIPPVRPVGAGEWAGHPLALIAPLHVYCWSAKSLRVESPWLQWLAATEGSARTASVDGRVGAVGEWRPWPAHAAFADEVERWWPSDELPPTSSASNSDEIFYAERERVLLWRGVGGLIDFLA